MANHKKSVKNIVGIHYDSRSEIEHLDKLMTCLECGKHLRAITLPHLRKHRMTVDEYKQKYNLIKIFAPFSRGKMSIHSSKRKNKHTHIYCSACGKKLHVSKNISRGEGGYFCSADCFNRIHNLNIHCIFCGKLFTVQISEAWKARVLRRFCSYSCGTKYRIERGLFGFKSSLGMDI